MHEPNTRSSNALCTLPKRDNSSINLIDILVSTRDVHYWGKLGFYWGNKAKKSKVSKSENEKKL